MSVLTRTPIATAVLLALGSQIAQSQETTTLGEVVVTAQKRVENLQDVPVSIDAIGEQKLDELNVQNFKDYVQFLPSVTMAPSIGSGSSFNAVYMRGIATGGDGQATTSQPSVGMYLDEQTLTTIQGNLDIHLYDIARVEALAGPQGTLFGASSQAGTIRIITNKPDPSGFAADFAVEGNSVDGDDTGFVAEGMVNFPIGDNAAIRIVGWTKRDAGWIDNKPATRTYEIRQCIDNDVVFDVDGNAVRDPATGNVVCTIGRDPSDDLTTDNADRVENNYNTSDTYGLRAALRINLGENWVVTPQAMFQNQEQDGAPGDDLNDVLASGDYAVAHFRDEFVNDEWWQAGLTIEGKIGNLDLVYSGNYLSRDVEGAADYSDYSYWYDNLYYTGYFATLFVDNDGNQLNPDAAFENYDYYTKQSHEIRVSTPQDNRVRGLVGLYYQKQFHDFYQPFGLIEGLADIRSMNGCEGSPCVATGNTGRYDDYVYLNSMDRRDTDEAIFGSLSFDITDDLELSLGARYFEPETSVKGFFGFGLGLSRARAPGTANADFECTQFDTDHETCIAWNFANPLEPGDPANGGDGDFDENGPAWSPNGEWRCPSQEDSANDEPCQNVDKTIKESDQVFRVNLSWNATDTAMLYATWSEGYRPGGINRNPFAGGYVSDFLTNYELGWKARFAGDRLQFNGAVFLEEWDDIQVSFQGANGITQVANGGAAEVQGIEAQLDWLATDNLRIGAGAAYYDSELTEDYVDFFPDGTVSNIKAPKGTALPLTPKFKGNLIARYSFPLVGFDAYTQGAFTYQDGASSELEIADNEFIGEIPSSTFANLAFGLVKEKYTIELFVSNATNEDAPLGINTECTTSVCGVQPIAVRARPRTFGIRYSYDF
jgi:outer membrane receptor protein involved in Fe transport